MQSNNKEVNPDTNRNQSAGIENLDTYKFYNLLYSGKINIKEYLSALRFTRDSGKKG